MGSKKLIFAVVETQGYAQEPYPTYEVIYVGSMPPALTTDERIISVHRHRRHAEKARVRIEAETWTKWLG